MASRRGTDPEETQRRSRPATTPMGRENQLIALATDLAEKRLREGTATAAEVVHFLKLGSTREQLEQERLKNENLLLAAKADSISSAGRMEELVGKAIEAMRSYRSSEPDEAESYDD